MINGTSALKLAQRKKKVIRKPTVYEKWPENFSFEIER